MSRDGHVGDPLARRFRRLLLAYPRSWRRAHGEEMLGTLLDTAAPGQTRPTRAEVVDVLGNGLRRRLMPPPGVLPHLAAAVFALVMTAVGIAGGTRVGWQVWAPPLPGDTGAVQLSRQAVPDLTPVAAPDRFDVLFDYDLDGSGGEPDSIPFPGNVLLGGDDYGNGWVDVTYRTTPDRVDTVIDAARDRLAAAGWQVGPVETDWGRHFTAHRGGYDLEVTDSAMNRTTAESQWIDDGRPAGSRRQFVTVGITRAEPVGVPVLGLAVGLAGLLAGWVVAARTARVARRRPVGIRVAHLFLTGFGLTFLLGTAVLTVGVFGARLWSGPDPSGPEPYWAGYVILPFTVVHTLGLVALSAGTAVLVVRRWPGRARVTGTVTAGAGSPVARAGGAPARSLPVGPVVATAVVAVPVVLMALLVVFQVGALVF